MGLEAGIWALRLKFGARGWDMGLEAAILALRMEFELKAGIWASGLGFGP